jgi:type I restriction enzyme S subunit
MIFYKETDFQETSIGKIPSDWNITKLREVLRLRNGERPKIQGVGNIPIFGANGIMSYTNEVLVDNEFTIIVGRVGASGQVHLGMGKIWVSDNAIYSEKYDNARIYPPFLFYLLRYRQLEQFALKTTHPIITQTFLNNFLIHLPPLEEQRAIAGVLGVVDSVIAKTDEVIAKTERLKKGLMQTLLTRGIGHEEFKDTEIGRIPKGWEVVKLKDACIEITDGSHWSPRQVEKSEYRIATVANLKELYIDIDSCKFISEEDYLRLVKEGDVSEEGDVLFSKDGTVGICFTFRQSNYKIGLLSSIAIIRPNRHILFSDFLVYALKSPNVFWQVTGRKTGTALTRITLDNLKKVKIPIPPLSEQQKIAKALFTVDMNLELEKKEKAKLERIKQELMDLLLTGKIRVKVD